MYQDFDSAILRRQETESVVQSLLSVSIKTEAS